MDKKAMAVLTAWDPLQKGQQAYEHEVIDVVNALHQIDHPTDLAKKIRDIYAHSFKFWIPIEKCVEVSYQLLAIKYKEKRIV